MADPSFVIADLVGYVGVTIYLGAYLALQAGIIAGTGYRYAVLNMIGAVCVLISLSHSFNLSSAVIQVAFLVISVGGITRTYLRNRRLTFTEEEALVIEHGFVGAPLLIAREILDAGTWIDADRGLRLTAEGEPVEALYFVCSGVAAVHVGAKHVADVRDTFIGEMNVMQGGPASATVEMDDPGRLFKINGSTLRKLAARKPEVAVYIEQNLGLSTRRKLLEANKRLSHAHGDG